MGNVIQLLNDFEFKFETEEETINRLNQKNDNTYSDRIILSQYFTQNIKNTRDTNILKEFKSRKRKNISTFEAELSSSHSTCEDENFLYSENINNTAIDNMMVVPAYFLPKDNIKIVDSLRMSEYCSYLLKPPKVANIYELGYEKDKTPSYYESNFKISDTGTYPTEDSNSFHVLQQSCHNNEFTENKNIFEIISDNINENNDIIQRLNKEDSPFKIFINESDKDNMNSAHYYCNSKVNISHETNDSVINANNIQSNVSSRARTCNYFDTSISCEKDDLQLFNSDCETESIKDTNYSTFENCTEDASDKDDIIKRLENECLSIKFLTNENCDPCIENTTTNHIGFSNNDQQNDIQLFKPVCEINELKNNSVDLSENISDANIDVISFQTNEEESDVKSTLDSQDLLLKILPNESTKYETVNTLQYFCSSNKDKESSNIKSSQIERNTHSVLDSDYYSQTTNNSQNEKIVCSQYFSTDTESQPSSSQSKTYSRKGLNLSKLRANLSKCGIEIKERKNSNTVVSSLNKATLNEEDSRQISCSQTKNLKTIQENLQESSKVLLKLNKNLNIITEETNKDSEHQGEENIICSQYFSTNRCTENLINSEQTETTSKEIQDDTYYIIDSAKNIQMNIAADTKDNTCQTIRSKRKKSDTGINEKIKCTQKKISKKSTPEDEAEKTVFTKDFLPNKLRKFKNEPNKKRLKIPVPKSESPRIPLGGLRPLWTPPKSPHGLIEEDYTSNPWGLLVATIFLNKTSGRQAKPYIDSFLQKYPNPESVICKKPEDLEPYFVELGLIKTRAYQIWRMSKDFLEKNWKNARELHGIGKYGDDAFRLFCIGDLSVEPSDRYLKIYHSWVKNRHVRINNYLIFIELIV